MKIKEVFFGGAGCQWVVDFLDGSQARAWPGRAAGVNDLLPISDCWSFAVAHNPRADGNSFAPRTSSGLYEAECPAEVAQAAQAAVAAMLADGIYQRSFL